ncbi:MAG TPA: rRNA methyltransferase [Candidatus Moranbacteria bacterium]|nr:rRNA methyltransferase [Candidatus Moranbacteria bacterium]
MNFAPTEKNWPEIFARAGSGRDERVVLDGLHALKHAVRFGAEPELILTPNREKLSALAQEMGLEELRSLLEKSAREVEREVFDSLARRPIPTGVIALARRPRSKRPESWEANAPAVFLDQPRDVNNIGAAVRVAAACGAAGLAVSAAASPWHRRAVAAGAGLQFALPTATVEAENLREVFAPRPIIACDERGRDLREIDLPRNALFVFGSERVGISSAVREAAAEVISLPMRRGVSSLNLATAVSAVLYLSLVLSRE